MVGEGKEATIAIKRSDIYRSLWESCDQLRGGMDASLYKDYILTLLFVKYVSDRAGQPDALIEVPEGSSFDDMKRLRGMKNIGEEMDKIISRLAETLETSTGIFPTCRMTDWPRSLRARD